MVNRQSRRETAMTTMIAMFTFDFSLYRRSLHLMLTATWLDEESVVFVREHIYSAGKVSVW